METFLAFYNQERSHQGLGNRTPEVVRYRDEGGGVTIAAHFSERSSGTLTAARRTAGGGPDEGLGQRQSAAIEA